MKCNSEFLKFVISVLIINEVTLGIPEALSQKLEYNLYEIPHKSNNLEKHYFIFINLFIQFLSIYCLSSENNAIITK